MSKKDHGKEVFEMLRFQYKPLEALLRRELKGTELLKKYEMSSYYKKIQILDKVAKKLKL